MWENFQTFAVWWTITQFALLGFFVIVGIFTGSPFRAPEDIYEPHGDTTGYDRSGKDYRP
jgi:hypothetical protein